MSRNPDAAGHAKSPDRPRFSRGYACIGLDSPKDAANIGCVMRAAGCYDAQAVFVQNARYHKTGTDTQKAWKHIPLIHVASLKDIVLFGCEPVAVDLVEGATELSNFVHPERAFYIFGGEDRTLDNSVLDWCKYRVKISTRFCMNLAACVNVVLYDRQSKQGSAARTVTSSTGRTTTIIS